MAKRRGKRSNRNNNNKKANYVIPGDVYQIAKRMSQMYNRSALSYGRGLKPKSVTVGFEVLEQMADRNPIVNAIIQKRCSQVRAYCQPAGESEKRGFVIKPIQGKGDPAKIQAYTNFFLQTGFAPDPDREDDFSDYVQYLVRDALVFDQVSTEVRKTKGGNIFDFWYVDGTSIVRLSPESPEFEKGYRYAQRDENGRVVAFFKPEDLIFDYMNKRSQLKKRGYGYSPLEMMIDLVTTFLFSMTYNKDMFIKDRVPKGFLKVMGDVNKETLDNIRDHWVAEMTGYGARFGIPIIPSGKEGVGIDYQSLGQTNRDMEYHKLVSFIVSLMCAVYSIDAAEIGLKVNESRTLIGERPEPRLTSSRSTGLGSLLMFVQTNCNKILQLIDPEYMFVIKGLEDDDKKKELDEIDSQIKTYRTIDEVRIEKGEKPFKKKWSQMPLRPETVQLEQGESFGGGEGGEPGGEITDEDIENFDFNEDTDDDKDRDDDKPDSTNKTGKMGGSTEQKGTKPNNEYKGGFEKSYVVKENEFMEIQV